MDKHIIWYLSDLDYNELEDLYEKKIALENLVIVAKDGNSEICDRLIDEYRDTLTKFNNWWIEKSKKYCWEGSDWELDFETHNILSIER